MQSLTEILNKVDNSDHYDKVFLSTGEVANITGNTTSTLATWRCTKKVNIPYIKIGKTVRYRLSDVLNYLDKMTSQEIVEGN
jgi:predicted DNA-binding transcriptional regulator AlpA